MQEFSARKQNTNCLDRTKLQNWHWYGSAEPDQGVWALRFWTVNSLTRVTFQNSLVNVYAELSWHLNIIKSKLWKYIIISKIKKKINWLRILRRRRTIWINHTKIFLNDIFLFLKDFYQPFTKIIYIIHLLWKKWRMKFTLSKFAELWVPFPILQNKCINK
jgi:hypothetical protein